MKNLILLFLGIILFCCGGIMQVILGVVCVLVAINIHLMEDRLCVPFSMFHKAIEVALGRSVFTHEFGLNRDGLKDELFNGKAHSTMEEIINMIPEAKRLIVLTAQESSNDTL